MEKTKTITIEVPEGKTPKWINGVLTLTDEQPKDERPVTERIKTYADAVNELGNNHPLVIAATNAEENNDTDLQAYTKLRVITAALNEGWKPKFEKDEKRWYPWYYLYTKEEMKDFDNEQKSRCVGRAYNFADADGGLVFASANFASSFSSTNVGARLAFSTLELARYAGKQFKRLYAEWLTNWELEPETNE